MHEFLENRPLGKRLKPVADEFTSAVRIAKAAGLRGWEARTSADTLMESMFGFSVMKMLKIETPRELDGSYQATHVQEFLSDCTINRPGSQVGKQELFDVYQQWADREQEESLSITAFRRTMLDIGHRENRHKDGRVWVSLALVDEKECSL